MILLITRVTYRLKLILLHIDNLLIAQLLMGSYKKSSFHQIQNFSLFNERDKPTSVTAIWV